MLKMSRLFLIGSAVSLMAQVCWADNSSSSSNVNQPQTSFFDNVKITFATDVYGGAVTDPLSSLQPDATTGQRDASNPILTESAVIVGYKLDATTLSAAGGFDYVPVREKQFTMLDPSLRATNMSLFKAGEVTFGTQVRAYLPVSEASRNANMITNIRWYQFASYQVPSSKVTLRLTTYLRPYFYSTAESGTDNRTLNYVYAGPQLVYDASPQFSAWLLFEYLGKATVGQGFFNLTPYTDLEFGTSWNISSKLSFTPYIDIKTSNRVAWDTTTINANLTFNAL